MKLKINLLRSITPPKRVNSELSAFQQHQIHKFQRSIRVVIEFYDFFHTRFPSEKEIHVPDTFMVGLHIGRGAFMGILSRLHCEILKLVFLHSSPSAEQLIY